MTARGLMYISIPKFSAVYIFADLIFAHLSCAKISATRNLETVRWINFHDLGDRAKTLFENLKKRYSKKRSALKKANQSGTSAAVVEKAKIAYDLYNFLMWLEEHIVGRSTMTNVKGSQYTPPSQKYSDRSEDEEDQYNDAIYQSTFSRPADDLEMSTVAGNEEDNVDDEDQHEPQPLQHTPELELRTKPQKSVSNNISQVTGRTKHTKAKESKNKKPRIEKDDLEVVLLQEIRNDLQKNSAGEKDTEDLFGDTIAAELKQLDPMKRCIAKNEIRNVIFRHQMDNYRKERPQQSHANSKPYYYNFMYQQQSNYQANSNRVLQLYQNGLTSPGSSSNNSLCYTDMLEQ